MQMFVLKERNIKTLGNFIITRDLLKQFRKVRKTFFPKFENQHTSSMQNFEITFIQVVRFVNHFLSFGGKKNSSYAQCLQKIKLNAVRSNTRESYIYFYDR